MEAWNGSWQHISLHGPPLPWDLQFTCPLPVPIRQGNTRVHGVFYHMYLACAFFLGISHNTYYIPWGGGGRFSKCSYRGGVGVVVSNSFPAPLEDKHGERREAKHAKHRRHCAKAKDTSRFCCLMGQYHGHSWKIRSHNTSTNAEPLLIYYVADKKGRAL